MISKKIILGMASLVLASAAMAGAVHDASLFTANSLGRNDDESSALTSMGFSANFFGTTYSSLFVNNNGNVTFDQAMFTFTPFALTGNAFPVIAPFFADVDTRGAASGVTQYGTGILGGHKVFGVNWLDVGYFSSHSDKLNSFQLILTDRSDTGGGNFDIEFNYDKIQWEAGDLSGGAGGLGGSTTGAAGYTDGGAHDFEFGGSRIAGSFLDSKSTGLVHGSRNSSTLGQYVFQVRNGDVVGSVPEPSSLALAGFALATLLIRRSQRTPVRKAPLRVAA